MPVKEDWDHGIDVDSYKIKRKVFQEKEDAWMKNKAKCYYLVLSRYPKELETELSNYSKWAVTEDN